MTTEPLFVVQTSAIPHLPAPDHRNFVRREESLAGLAPRALPVEDFIMGYADYADVREIPREMHEAVAVQLIASVLNRAGVTITLGADTYSFDLWQVLLSGSGAGRSSLLTAVYRILEAAGMSDLIRDVWFSSPQALYQELAEHPSGLFVWGEISELLQALNDKSFRGAKPWFTDRYDNTRAPSAHTYRRTNKSSDTPPIVFKQAPRTNILATSSEQWFFSHLAQEDSAGGFVPRWMLVRIDAPTKDVPITKELDDRRAKSLSEHLRRVAVRADQKVDLTQVLGSYVAWYRRTRRRFEAQPDQKLAQSFFGRHRGHILKLAVICEVASSLSLKVTQRSWDRAERMASGLEETIFELLPTGMSASGHLLKRMEDRIKKSGDEGLSQSEFTKAFQQQEMRVRRDYLDTLVETGAVSRYFKETGGRTATILVHRHWTEKYLEKHPEANRSK